jgi:hypothetical protein
MEPAVDTPAQIADRVRIGLDALSAMIADLQDGGQVWDAMDDVERASWSLDWTQLMSAHLPILELQYHQGALGKDQQRRYQRLRRELQRVGPTIDRLRLTPPTLQEEIAGRS